MVDSTEKRMAFAWERKRGSAVLGVSVSRSAGRVLCEPKVSMQPRARRAGSGPQGLLAWHCEGAGAQAG